MHTELAARLTCLAPALASGGQGIANLQRLTGGASLQTWAFDVVGLNGTRPLILRRRQAVAETVFETSLPLRIEAQLLRGADTAGVPVAKVVRDCPVEDGLDEALVLERVEGETLGRRIVTSPDFSAAREVLGRQCGEALARVHAMPLNTLPTLERLDAAATLARYEDIHRRSGAVRPVIEAALRHLAASLPAPVPSRLIHGDFRNGNLIVDGRSGLCAVLDWELTHLGDPAEDFGWLCVNSWRFGATEKPVGGFATLEALVAGYRAEGGEPPAQERIRFWMMMGSLRWSVIADMMYRAFAAGEHRSLERAVIGRRVSECEVDLLTLMETAG